MTMITNLFTQNPVEAFVGIVIIIAIIILIATKKKSDIYNAALFLVSVAEDEWGSETGQIKFAQVITSLKEKFPIITIFTKESIIKDIIEDALINMKEILASKKAAQEKLEAEEIAKLTAKDNVGLSS